MFISYLVVVCSYVSMYTYVATVASYIHLLQKLWYEDQNKFCFKLLLYALIYIPGVNLNETYVLYICNCIVLCVST